MIEEGFIFTETTEVTEYIAATYLFCAPGQIDMPDLMIKESTDAFIELTHELYKESVSEFFGDTIVGVFSDEPNGGSRPFRKELEEIFEERYGYSFRPFLPEFLGKKAVEGKACKAVADWLDICSEQFCKNYLATEKKWSNENDMLFLGHLNGESNPMGGNTYSHFGVLRALRNFDIPGIDAIWRQIFPGKKNDDPKSPSYTNKFYPRYASSAASQIGSHYAITESFGVYGSGLTFDEMRFALAAQAVRGINIFNFMFFPYAREGVWMAGEMPFIMENQACYADMKPFNKYTERLTYLAELGTNKSETALYIPIKDSYLIPHNEKNDPKNNVFERTADELEDSQIPFEFVDDDVFTFADPDALANGVICMGNAKYTSVIVTPCELMPEKSISALEKFILGGGKVFTVMQDGLCSPKISGSVEIRSAKNLFPSPLKFIGENLGIRVCEKKLDNGTLFLIFNENNTPADVRIDIGDENCYLLELTHANVSSPEKNDGCIDLHLLRGELVGLLFTDNELACTDSPTLENELTLDSDYTFRKTYRFRVGEMHYEPEYYNEESSAAILGDWCDTLGKDFSGSGVYRTVFTAPKVTGKAVLDLGDVRYTCETFLNGKSLGLRVMPPYSYVIDASDFAADGENVLEIRVTNTVANEYFHTKVFEKWAPWQMTPYWLVQKPFFTEALFGGLYGPVKLKY